MDSNRPDSLKYGESEFYPEGATRDKFCVEIQREDYPVEGCYRITIWAGSAGMGAQTPIRKLSKARRIARFIYETHYPEHVAAEAAKEVRYAALDQELSTRAEERRAEAETRRAELLARITPQTERVKLAECPSCQHRDEPETFGQRVYECSRCGQTQIGDDNRRCESCNIFMARVGDLACPSCEDALDEEPELILGVLVDGDFIPESEIEEAA